MLATTTIQMEAEIQVTFANLKPIRTAAAAWATSGSLSLSRRLGNEAIPAFGA